MPSDLARYLARLNRTAKLWNDSVRFIGLVKQRRVPLVVSRPGGRAHATYPEPSGIDGTACGLQAVHGLRGWRLLDEPGWPTCKSCAKALEHLL